jgi:hypothetical protein
VRANRLKWVDTARFGRPKKFVHSLPGTLTSAIPQKTCRMWTDLQIPRSAVVRIAGLLGLVVRISLKAWMFVSALIRLRLSYHVGTKPEQRSCVGK